MKNKFWLDTYQKFIQYKYLREGLISTTPIEKAKEKFDNLRNINLSVEITSSNFLKIELNLKNIKDKHKSFKKVLKLGNLLGYREIRIIVNNEILIPPFLKNYNNQTKIIIYFDKKFPEELNNIKFLYHVTLKELWIDKISKNGLKPKSVVEQDDTKIYLLSSLDFIDNFIDEKIEQLENNFLQKYLNINDWVILTINELLRH